jgi:hypothetical protein
MVLSSLPAFSATDKTPLLQISDGTSTVTVDGAGTYTCNGTCSNTGITLAAPTSITFNGTVGNFTIVVAQGNSNSTLSSTTLAPAMDIGIGTLINGGSTTGTLTVTWTDVGFNGVSPTTITPLTTYIAGTGTTNVYMYVDNSDSDYQGIAAGTSILSASATGLTGPTSPISGAGITANPFGITLKEVITLSGGGVYTNDFSGTATAGTIAVAVPPSPMLSLSKCVTTNGMTCVTGSTSVAPFTKVTYLYTVKNTSTNTTLPVTGITITDDNATPNYTGDDFTVCTIASLAPGGSTSCTASVYPPVTEGANDTSGWGNQSFNYGSYHPGGTLICRTIDSKGNLITNGGSGNLEFHWVLDEATVDNTYGNGAKGDWQLGSAFGNLLNNAYAEFQVYDAKGNQCIDVWQDYLAGNSSALSGYSSGGIVYGSGGNYVLSTDTSLSRCLNKNKATAKCTSSSPTTSSEWNSKCAYIVRVSSSCWGSNGFGRIECPNTTTGNPKSSQCGNHTSKPVNSTATNTAVASGFFGSTTVTSNKATATVAIVATPTQKCQVPVQLHCNVYAQAPSNCKPINGGHDNDGYSYSDSLLTSTINWNGTQFQLGGGSDPSASTGQKIPLPAAQCSSVKFLAAGVNGAQYNQPFTINYTDGTSTTVYQNVSDWCYPSGFSGESNVLTMPYRITPNGSQQWINTSLYGYSIPTNSSKTIDSITCPNNRNVIVHAVTLCP